MREDGDHQTWTAIRVTKRTEQESMPGTEEVQVCVSGNGC